MTCSTAIRRQNQALGQLTGKLPAVTVHCKSSFGSDDNPTPQNLLYTDHFGYIFIIGIFECCSGTCDKIGVSVTMFAINTALGNVVIITFY